MNPPLVQYSPSSVQSNLPSSMHLPRQVSTGDGLASHLVVLEVVAPRAVIPGQGVHHVQAGSTISLTCLIEQVNTHLRLHQHGILVHLPDTNSVKELLVSLPD